MRELKKDQMRVMGSFGEHLREYLASFLFGIQQSDLTDRDNTFLLRNGPKNLYFLTDNQFLFYSIFKFFDIIQKYRADLLVQIDPPQCRKWLK